MERLLESPCKIECTQLTDFADHNDPSAVVPRDRYCCKVAFARVLLKETLSDVIPFELFPILPHVQAWAHGLNNILNPLRRPKGDYFKDAPARDNTCLRK
mmetsp:Transcript_39329/g.58421  ORF Transcript_39329/g.58421 Transcript_39329/m.58421 type:complete len:100 (-) Transcript_39329:3-302(-)